tara:strand:+ start:103 stop:333 length:231 start_codon:yes stop_codon:yes gene_type:complete
MTNVNLQDERGERELGVSVARRKLLMFSVGNVIEDAGADVTYHIYRGRDHFVHGLIVGNKENRDWLFKQEREERKQ